MYRNMSIGASGGVFTSPLLGPDGSAAAPTYSFASDPDTGMYRTAANGVSLAAGGVDRIAATSTASFLFSPDGLKRFQVSNQACESVTNPLWIDDGSAAAPGFAFAQDPDTGIYRDAVNVLGLAAAGVAIAVVNGTTTQFQSNFSGTVGAPFYSFIASPSMGMYRGAAGDLRLTGDGATYLSITAGITYAALLGGTFTARRTGGNQGAFTVYDTAEVLGAQLLGGTGGSGRLNFQDATGTTDTRLYRTGVRSLTLDDSGGTDGNLRLALLNFGTRLEALSTAGLIYNGDGAAATPCYTFGSDTDTGMYRLGVNSIGFATGGALRASITSSFFIVASSQLTIPDGSAGNPSLCFSNDTNTGMYAVAADQIGLSTGGTLRVTLSTTTLKSTLPHEYVAGNEQTTVGAAGGASALPATPTKYLKIVDSAGTTLVVPAYAAA